jgi:hypothetical protein
LYHTAWRPFALFCGGPLFCVRTKRIEPGTEQASCFVLGSLVHYTLNELIELWKREKLTTEQVIGQMLQVLREQEGRLSEVERSVEGKVAGSRCGEREL